MSAIPSPLVIPEEHYGKNGKCLLEDIASSLKTRFNVRYDKQKQALIIKNSEHLALSAIESLALISSNSDATKYWAPKFINLKNSVDTVVVKLFCSYIKTPDIPEIQELELEIEKSIKETIDKIMEQPDQPDRGIWYSDDIVEKYPSALKNFPKGFHLGYLNPEYFERTNSHSFTLKNGKSATEGLSHIINGPSILDCGNTIQVIYYKALLDVLGNEKFEQIFSSDEYRLQITQGGLTCHKSPINFFSKFTDFCLENFRASQSTGQKPFVGKLGHRPVKKNEVCFFKGISFLYSIKHPLGSSNALNVICLGDNNDEQVFYGQGLKKPLTENGISEHLVKAYNQEPSRLSQKYKTFLLENANDDPHEVISILGSFNKESFETILQVPYTIHPHKGLKNHEIIDGFSSGSISKLDSKTLLEIRKSPQLPKLKSIEQRLFEAQLPQPHRPASQEQTEKFKDLVTFVGNYDDD